MSGTIHQRHIAVVGGGISGIAAAFNALKRGWTVEILESDAGLGGRVGSAKLGDQAIDFGGKNIGRHYPRFRQFVQETGPFTFEYFGINTSKIVDGRLIAVNREENFQTFRNLLKTFKWKDLGVFAGMAAVVRSQPKNGALGGSWFRSLEDRCDEQPVTHYFSNHFCQHFWRPIIVRMNGAEPHEYYMGCLGTNVKMAMDKYDQVSEGLHAVLSRFARRVQVRVGCHVQQLVFQGTRVVGVAAIEDGRATRREYDGVILATTAKGAAAILQHDVPMLSQALETVRYFPVGIAVVQYKRDVFTPDVRALMFDENYPLSNAGAYGKNALNVVRYTFSGQAARTRVNTDTSAEEVIDLAESILDPYFPVRACGRGELVYRYFSNGLCAYSAKHCQLLDRVNAIRRSCRGLALAGDYLRGASMETCFQSGEEAVEQLLDLR